MGGHQQPLNRDESKYTVEKSKKKKSPPAATKVSPFWVFAVKECSWTGLKGEQLAQYAGSPGAWPSMRPEEREEYVEESRRLTAENRAARDSAVAKAWRPG